MRAQRGNPLKICNFIPAALNKAYPLVELVGGIIFFFYKKADLALGFENPAADCIDQVPGVVVFAVEGVGINAAKLDIIKANGVGIGFCNNFAV